MSVQYVKHIFIITNTMHTIGVDKVTLFKNHLKQLILSYMFRSSLDHHQGVINSVYDESILKGDEYTDDA